MATFAAKDEWLLEGSIFFEELTTALIWGLRWFNRSLLEVLLRLGHVSTIVAGELLASSPTPRRFVKVQADATMRLTAWRKAPAMGSDRR
jgi:hypothetical protein